MNKEVQHKYRFLAKVAKENQTLQWLKNPNVNGVSFGRRIVHNQITDDPSIVVYVNKKVGKSFLPPSQLLPRKIFIGGDWIDVDIVETGPFYPLAFTLGERPAPSGISIGNLNDGGAGTLGCLVTDQTDGSTCILTNNHVIASVNAAALGEVIVQQGVIDGGTAMDQIGTLKRFQNINPAGNIIDAAIAQVTNVADVVNQMKDNLMAVPNPDHPAVGLLFAGSCNRTSMNPIRNVLNMLTIDFIDGGPAAVVDAEIDMNVEKVGRTTEYTTSTILEIDATINVDYGTANNPDVRSFDNQIQTAWMSDRGDSGSIVCRGGEGGNEDKCGDGGCGSSSAASSILQRDIREDIAVEKVFREKYLATTRTGRFLLDTYFRNEDTILERVNKVQSDEEDAKFVNFLYDKYSAQFRAMAINVDSKDKLTGKHVEEGKQSLGRVSKYLDKNEQKAAEQLFRLAENFEGKTTREALEILDGRSLYNNVVKIVSRLDSLKHKDCC